MREICKSGSEGGAGQYNAPFLPLSFEHLPSLIAVGFRTGFAAGLHGIFAALFPSQIPFMHRTPTHAGLPGNFRTCHPGIEQLRCLQSSLLLSAPSAGHRLQ